MMKFSFGSKNLCDVLPIIVDLSPVKYSNNKKPNQNKVPFGVRSPVTKVFCLRLHVQPVTRYINNNRQLEPKHVLRIKIAQCDKKSQCSAAVRQLVQHAAKFGACNIRSKQIIIHYSQHRHIHSLGSRIKCIRLARGEIKSIAF